MSLRCLCGALSGVSNDRKSDSRLQHAGIMVAAQAEDHWYGNLCDGIRIVFMACTA